MQRWKEGIAVVEQTLPFTSPFRVEIGFYITVMLLLAALYWTKNGNETRKLGEYL